MHRFGNSEGLCDFDSKDGATVKEYLTPRFSASRGVLPLASLR